MLRSGGLNVHHAEDEQIKTLMSGPNGFEPVLDANHRQRVTALLRFGHCWFSIRRQYLSLFLSMD